MAIGYRATASAGGGNSVAVTIPSATQVGDGMVLLAYANLDCVISTPAGWTVAKAQQSAEAGGATAVVFKRVAQTGDASSSVTVTNDGVAGVKAGAEVAVWSGTDQVDFIHVIQSRLDTGGSANIPTPAATTTAADCWVAEMLASKASSTTALTSVPSGSTQRIVLIGTGGGHVDGAIADRGPVAAGSYGGGDFVEDAAVSSAITYTIGLLPRTSTQVLRPASDVTVGSYTAVPVPGAGVAFASRIGETIRDDTTYIQTPVNPSAAVYECRLPFGLDPSSSDDHTVTTVLWTEGGATSSTCVVAVVQGTTVIGSGTFASIPDTPTLYSFTLTGGEADTITDYDDLRLRWTWTAA